MSQPPSRPFSPPVNPMSPSNISSPSNSFYPPNKRQRLSPNPSSPAALSPNSPNVGQQMYLPGNGVAPSGMPATSPQVSGAMGPPSRPVEKATNTSDLTDAIAQSGIDIRDEENNLTAYFSQSRSQNDNSFTSNNVSSFESTVSSGSDPGPPPVRPGYYPHPPNAQGVPAPYFGGGSFNQPPLPRKSADELAQEEWKAAVRRQAQVKAIHLNDPFLYGNSVRLRMGRKAYDSGVRLPQEGFSERPLQPPKRVNTASVIGPDGSSLTALTANVLDGESQLSDILTLISLATQERLRILVEEAASLAVGRRIGSHGQVPPEWLDLATKTSGQDGVLSTTETNGRENAASPKKNPLKRSFSSGNKLPTPVSDGTTSPANVRSFPNDLAKAIRGVASKERDAEEARAAKRTRRANAATSSADASRAGSASLGTSGPGTPAGTPGDRALAPEVKKISKKELAKQQSARVDEAHQHKSANNTARMMLGGGGGGLFGKKKSGYSWMNAGGAGGGTTTPNKGNTATTGAGGGTTDSSAAGAGANDLSSGLGRRMGEWREDRERGAGIQFRDIVNALEADGREHKSLAFAYSRMK